METMPKSSGESPFPIMIRVLFNPTEGWKTLRRSGITPEQSQSQCFYPLLALLSASEFSKLFYTANATIQETLISAVISFVSFFAGYYCIMLALKTLLNADSYERFETDFGKNFIILALSTLCLFFIMLNLLPMFWAILIFLPLWTVYSICRGIRFFRFTDNCKLRNTILICILVIGVPSLLDWILNEITV